MLKHDGPSSGSDGGQRSASQNRRKDEKRELQERLNKLKDFMEGLAMDSNLGKTDMNDSRKRMSSFNT